MKLLLRCCLATVVALSAAVGAQAQPKNPEKLLIATFDKADTFELFSLDPLPSRIKPKETFHNWKVLGSMSIRDIETRKKLITALLHSIEEAEDSKPGPEFTPKDGIRATTLFGTKVLVVDLVLSFDGTQGELYIGGKKDRTFTLTTEPQAVFDKVLTDEKVPLPPVPKKEDPLPGFPQILYNADFLEVVGHDKRPLLSVVKTEYDKDKKEIVWLLEAQNDLTYEDYIIIRTLWENGTGAAAKPPVVHFFNKDHVSLYTRELKEEGKLRNAKKGDCIRLILDASNGFPEATLMEFRAP